MSKVAFSIMYAGLQLPIVKNERCQDVTPLKPIADLFGLSWTDQHKKVTGNHHLTKYLGICLVVNPHADGQKREQTCILLSRVAAYLMSISPERVQSAGNVDGAKFLMEKQEEWADALHDYEELGVAVNLNHAKAQEALRRQRLSFAQMIGLKNKTTAASDRAALSNVIGQMAAELGVPYQLELAEGAGQGA
ncbi:MAG: phage antirepressor N-terminal domain-containing protein [Burkholderiales bacterium]|nr:phage antirepressor N-terminal domain-containing protein [Burkholderiales bacterium]